MEKKFRIAKTTISFLTIASLVLIYFPFGTINTAVAAVSQVSRQADGVAVSTNPTTGFPFWYQDVAGIALQQCLGTNIDSTGPADPKCILPGFITIPNINTSPSTFPAESFFYFAEAPLDINGNAGRFRLLLEAAFANGTPALGDQSVFARASLFTSQAGVLPRSGTFHAVYPFGSFDFTTDAAGGIVASSPVAPFQPNGGGAKEIRAEDGLVGPLDFTSVLSGNNTGMTTFLRSTTAPAGYLGDGVTATPVTGGTNGNAFILTGSGVDALGNPFSININQPNWVVAGKIIVIDTISPVITSVTPSELVVNSVGQVPGGAILSANVTDSQAAAGDGLGNVRTVTVDLGAIGNNFTTTINATQEVPPTASTRTGSGTFTIDTSANTLTMSINADIIPSNPVTHVHIHQGAAGSNGPMLFDAGNAVPVTNVIWNYPEAREADIMAGNTYIQIHTALFDDPINLAGGEIRGQIVPASNVQSLTRIAGTPANGTWRTLLPAITRTGTFNLPIIASDGPNVTNLNFSLSVINPPPVAVADAANIGTGIGESADIEVLLNDTDSNGNLPLSLVSVQNVSTGTAVIAPDGLHVVITAPTITFAGAITAQYTVADSLGATSNGNITVNVIRDITAPVVTILGANPVSVRLAGTYADAGATALDDFDGNVTANIVTTGLPVDTSTAGAKTVTYTVTDLVGNTGSLTRTVNVENPVLTTITVTPANLTVPLSGNRQMTATGFDQFGIAMSPQPAFTWTSANAGVAAVSLTGLVSGASLGGPVVITATVGAIQGTANATVVDGPVCTTTADADLSGSISNLEILNHVRSWKSGTVSNLDILNTIRFWRAGTGC